MIASIRNLEPFSVRWIKSLEVMSLDAGPRRARQTSSFQNTSQAEMNSAPFGIKCLRSGGSEKFAQLAPLIRAGMS